MIKIYHNTTEIPSTIGYEVRVPFNRLNYIPGAEGSLVNSLNIKGFDEIQYNSDGSVVSIQPVYKSNSNSSNGSELFYKYGFEFNNSLHNTSGSPVDKSEIPTGSYSGAINLGVYAIAAGKEEYAAGMLCEGYSKVRNHWLSEVKEALESGYDGIDIRSPSHSSYLIDYAYYGFNEPISEAYKNKYGSYPTMINAEVAKRIMEIRGEFFLQFLTDAANLTHDYNAKFITHIIASQYDNLFDANFKFTQYGRNDIATNSNQKIIINNYQKLIDISDEITIKDYYSDNYSKKEQMKQELILNYAKSKSKKVLIHCYLNQSQSIYRTNNPTFFNNLIVSKADGALLYEITHTNLSTVQNIINTYGQVNYEELSIVPVISVELNKTSISIQKGKIEQLTATVKPNDASNQGVTWTSSNEEVVTVDNTGKVTAKGKGSTTITVTTADGEKTAICKVKVTENPSKINESIKTIDQKKSIHPFIICSVLVFAGFLIFVFKSIKNRGV